MEEVSKVQHGIARSGRRRAGAVRLPLSVVIGKIAALLGAVAVLLLFVWPIARLVHLSVAGEAGLTLSIYNELLNQPRFWSALWNTFIIVTGSTLLSVVLGMTVAWLMAYTDLKYKKLLHLIILLCFILPSYVLTLSWSAFMGSQGMLAELLKGLGIPGEPWSMYSYSGIIFVMGIHHFPLVYLFTVDVLRKIPRDLEWASRAGGAGRLKTFRRITFPLAMPGLAAGGLLVFLASLDNFGIPAFLGTPANITVLSTLIYEEIIGFGPAAFARGASLSVILGIVAVIGTMLQWLMLRKSKTSETTMPDYSPRYLLGSRRKWVGGGLWALLLFITAVPLLAMISLSFKRAYGLGLIPSNLTLDNYRYILFENAKVWQSIQNSVLLSVVTLIICMVVGSIFAYIRVRKPSALSKAAELAIALPYTLPGIVFALSMILVWMQPLPGVNGGIYGTIYILYIAYICRFLILQIRASMTAFMQIDPSMEEAARIAGAGMWRKWKTILLPMLLPGIVSGGLLVFLTALTELTVSALLYSSGSQTIGVTIFSFEQAGNTLYSTALSSLIVLLIAVGGTSVLLLQKWLSRKGLGGANK
ncbi:iron(III) transport system permease protein [Paenibacillus algorifonticola]|uniref:Iron(III) transport system permease protein n=1 Tax=Paenibacillus algorifonticola TaxID=684063 RepID=A0A1I2ELR5_9BACL|nr:iron ABC transporter permease [Paenibacillus algorifonticola]SFE93388.1 iron(III) transport system permease protein [Paenibacillus algorifonticola]